MDDGAANAAAAAPEVDLENGGGGGGAVTVETWAYPARLKEKQPFTWLGAAPFIALMLVGVALVVAGVAIYDSGGPTRQGQGHDSQQPYHMSTMDQVGTALLCTGTVIALLGIFAGAIAADEGYCECNLPRFGPD